MTIERAKELQEDIAREAIALLTIPGDMDTGAYEQSTKTESTRYIKTPAETVDLLKWYRAAQSEVRLACGDR